MGLEQNFYQAVRGWVGHCRKPEVQVSSSSEPVKNSDSYRKLVSMGYQALPLIRQVYDRENPTDDLALSIIQEHGLVSVVREIMGNDFSIPEEIRGRTSAVKEYTKRWLDENMHRYM